MVWNTGVDELPIALLLHNWRGMIWNTGVDEHQL